jgi:hypothetical protein
MQEAASAMLEMLRLVRRAGRHFIAAMNERRVLLVLLLLAAAAAWYIWGRPDPADSPAQSPAKTDAEQRTRADPFPQSPP